MARVDLTLEVWRMLPSSLGESSTFKMTLQFEVEVKSNIALPEEVASKIVIVINCPS